MSDTPSNIVQQVILLATGAPSSTKLRDEILRLYETTGNWQQVAVVVDDYMNSQIPLTHNGISGLVQAMASDGLGLKLSVGEAEQVTLDLIDRGIDSWSKLFAFTITELTGEQGKVLDNRAVGAENFTDLLASRNKDSDFNGLQTLNAAREWLQGIGVSDVSLLEANKVASKLIAEFNHGNVRGMVLDNNVSGATVFIDENGNGIFDEGERRTITDQNGDFLFTGNVPRGNSIVTGGTDLATGRPFAGMLTAPEGAVVITPLTTLITLMLRNDQAQNIDMAEELLFNALDIPRVDLSVFDSVASALNSDTPAEQVTAVKIQAAVTQIVNLFNITSALISGFVPENSNVVQAAQHALLAHLTHSTNTNQGLDLSSPQILATIIKDTGTLVGIIDESNSSEETEQIDTLVGQTAALLHEINALVQKATNMFENGQIPDAISALSDMIKLQTLVKADITSAIEVNASSGDLGAVVNEFTGINLLKNLDEIETGSFNSNTPVNDGSVITNPVTPPISSSVLNNTPIAADDRQLSFDGVDDFVQIGSDPNLEMTATMTMEAWINPNSSSNVDQLIINKEGEYEVGLFPDGTIQWGFANSDPGWSWVDTGHVVTMNEWVHVAVSYDNGTINTYVNGTLVHTYNGSGIIGDAHPTFDSLVIGGRSNNPAGQYFDGSIGEVRIWNVARTDTEIAANYNQYLSGSESGLVGNWRLTEGTGTLVNDFSSLNNDGILGGGVIAQAPSWEGYTTNEDDLLNVPLFFGVLSNDSDAEGNPLTAILVSDVSNGTLNLSSNGSFTYTPDANFFGTDNFTYKVNDGAVDGTTATVAINVTSVNDAPVITSDGGGATANLNAAENRAAVTTVTSTDVDDGAAIYAISGGTDTAKFSINSSTGVLAFQATPDFENPTDTNLDNIYEVAVQVSDGNGGTDTQTISVTVTDQTDITVTTVSDINDSSIVDGNVNHDIDWLNANMGGDAAISLREAIIATNNTTNDAIPDTIQFNIAGVGPHTFTPLTALPTITNAVIINGTSEPDFAGTPVIELDGASAGAGVNGLIISGTGGGSTIQGLAIQNFYQNGLLLQGGTNTIVGNYIGLDADGSTVAGNNTSGTGIQGGIRIESADNTIGGLTAADRNVISGNSFSGIAIANAGATANLVIGNYIGTDAGGTLDRGNTQEGIEIDAANSNIIGGTTVNARNIISGNGSDGIEIDSADFNIVQGNYIGADVTGTVDLGNSRDGLDINANGADGATGNIIGGTNTNESNLIFGNDMNGIQVRNTPTIDNSILGNQIHGNGLLGIDLDSGNGGVTTNDGSDGDLGPNNLQNSPVLTVADIDSTSQLTIDGTLNMSGLSQDYRVEFFRNTIATGQDASGYGEGKDYLGFVTVRTDGSGNAAFSTTLTATVAAGEYISATATTDLGGGNFGDTSEFALNVTAAAVNDTPVITSDGGVTQQQA